MELEIKNANEYEAKGSNALETVKKIDVIDAVSYVAMGEVLSKIKQGISLIEENVEEPIKKAHELHKWLTGIRTKVMAPWKQAETEAKKRMSDFQYQEMVKRRVLEEKAAAEKAELEAAQMRKAQLAMEANKPKKAEQILAKPIETKTVVPDAIKTEKQQAVFVYSYEVEDIELVPREFMQLNQALVGEKVRKEKLACKIPGIKVIESAGIRSR